MLTGHIGQSGRNLQPSVFPPPEIVWPCKCRDRLLMLATERYMLNALLGSSRWPVVQRNLQQNQLHHNHVDRLDQQRKGIISTKPIEHPIMAISADNALL